MIYRIACVGRIKEQHFTQMLNEYKKEIDKRGRLEICEVPDERIPQKAGDKVNAMIIEAEADRLRHVIGRDDYVIALCIEGKKTTTEGLADQVRRASERGHDTVTFVIGGSLGLAADIVRRADYRMSVSVMSFPLQLIWVTLEEQLAMICR